MAPTGRGPLIVGSGIAGLFVALRLRELGLRPTVVTKSRLAESNTRYAQGGIAAAVGPDDSPRLHWADTIRAGAGLVDRRAARLLTEEAPRRIADLVRFGVAFDTADGVVALGREAAHSRARVLHAGGDATGLSIETALRARAIAEGIEVRERTVLRALVPGRSSRGIGAVVSAPDGSAAEELAARPVVLATGGAGGLYRNSSNPSITTGEGLSIAFRAGAELADMEFIQFHPTIFTRPGSPPLLMTEALRGEGAVLRNQSGERFLLRYTPQGELAPRDVVSRAIVLELRRTGTDHVDLDATGIGRDRLFGRFPTICRFLLDHGIDPSRDPIPVAPMAHYTIGGVRTDREGRTSLPGLYACGEVAATGVHGANRLASNSLLEGIVFGERVVRQIRSPHPATIPPARRCLGLLWPPPTVPEGPEATGPAAIALVRRTLWEEVGILRDEAGLSRALARFVDLAGRLEPETGGPERPDRSAHAVTTAYLIARAAWERRESRGCHQRTDFPHPRPSWRHHISIRRTGLAA
ncbi:MAG: L-aspartate oxidase [Thermoplasmata archaeon]